MAILNFPNTRLDGSPLQAGDQYTGDNGVTYIFDGVKWVGHAVAQPAGTNSITNAGHTVQVDSSGNLIIPTGATIIYESGAPVVTVGGSATTSTLINGSYTVSIGNDGKFQSNNTTITSLDLRDASGAGFYTSGDGYTLRSNGSNNWIFKTDGNIVVPTAGIIKANTDSYTGIATHDQQTFAYVNADGFFVDTLYNTAEYEWHFNNTGGLTLPSSIFPITFSAVLLPIYGGAPDIGPYGGDAWTLSVTFTEDANGVVSTSVAQIFPISNNPGYKTGDTYTFTETAHGIAGYTLTIVLDNVQYPGPAGWTANVECSQAPASPSTVSSNHAIKINSNNNIWAFGSDGTLTLPTGAEIVIDVPGSFVARSTSGITLFDNNANPSGMVEGDLGEVAFFADVNSAQNARISLVKMSATPGEPVVLNWTFDKNGVLTLPNGSTIGNGDAGAGVPITTSRGTILLGNVAECEGGESHFHIMKAGQQDIDLFLGDDSNYVKLPSTGGVEISSSEIGGQHYWRFGTDGYLTMESLHLQGYFKGVDGSTGTSGQVLTKNTNGGVYWADATGGSGGPVFQLTSGTAVVSLNTSGALTLPLGSQLLEKTWSTTITAITTGTQTFVTFAANEFNYPEQGQITISGVDTPNDVNSTWYYQASDPNQVELHYGEDFASPVDSTAWSAYTSGGTVTLITQLQLNSNGNIWKFMADGSTIVPNGQRVIFGEQNGGAYIQAGMGFHINSSEGISLEAVDLTNPAAPVSHGWYFGPDGTFHFPDNSIQTTSAQVQFRSITFPTGAAGDTQGALAYNTITNSFYLATASYVQQTLTTSTFDIVSNQPYDWGQSGDQFMSVTISKGVYAGIDTLLNAGVTTGWTISGTGIAGTVAVTNVSLHNTDNVSWSFDWAPQEGQPTSFSSGTAFTLYNTVTPAQPNIWEQIVTGQVWQLSSSTETLSMYNPYTDYVELATNSSTRMSIYAGQGFELANLSDLAYGSWNWNQETTGTIVYQGIYNDPTRGIAIENYHNNSIDPYVLFDNNGGIQFNDYATNPLGYPGFLTVPFASISRSTGTMTLGVTDFSVNTGTTATWTFSAPDGTLTHPGKIYSRSTATVTSGVARTAWSNFLASQFNNSNSPFIVQDVQHDQAGNVIATLTDANTGTNNANTITITTQTSMVVKYSPEGAVLWSQKITGPIAPATFGLAVDSGNNIYINLVDLATTTTTVVKLLGTDGSLVWATDLTDAGDAGFNALIGPDGNLVVNGVYNNAGSNNMYLMKINSTTGSVMWQKQLPDTGSNDIDTGLAIDPNSGNIAVSGSSQGANLGFVGIVNSNGNYVNGAEFTVNIGAGVCEVCDAIYDSQGHLYVSGAVSTASSVTAGFLAKIDTNLTLLWARQIGQGNGCIDVATSLVVDEHDNVYVSGFTSDPSHSGLPVTSLGSFAPDGTERWQYWFETPNNTVTLPGGLGAEAFQNSFTDLGNNTSYHNGMIALGVISGNESNYYPYVLQVPADGTPVSFGDIGIPDMLSIYSTTSTWAAITATVTVTTGLPLTISAGTLTVATDVSVASAGISLGYNGTFEYDYTTSTVYTSQQSWQFKPDGGLTLPLGGFITAPVGMGSNTVIKAPAGSAAILQDNSGSNQVSVGDNGIVMTTARGTVYYGFNLEAPGVPTHFHINKVDQSFDLFFGDDANYFHLPVGGASPVIGANDGSSGQKLYAFGQNGTLTVPGTINSTAGTGAVTINSSDGSTTHTWGFGTDGNLVVPGAIQSTNGIVISNAGVVGATAGIVLPANAGTGAVQIGNTYGPIQLGSAVGGGTELNWTFDTTGILTVPITASGAGQISGGTNGLQLVSNSNTWGFGTDASLTVPGIITLPNGQGQIGNGGAGIDIICNVNSYGYITLNYLSQASVSVNTSGIVLTSNSSSWTFNSGSIQFPDATNQLTAFELQGVSQSPWGTTYPSSGGIANLDYQFYFDPGTGHPTIQSYSSNGGNPLYNSIWSYDAWLAANDSANPIAGSSGTTPIQVNNTGGSVILSSVLQPGDYVTVRIQCIDTGRIFRATFMGSVNPNDFGITYGAITVERLL